MNNYIRTAIIDKIKRDRMKQTISNTNIAMLLIGLFLTTACNFANAQFDDAVYTYTYARLTGTTPVSGVNSSLPLTTGQKAELVYTNANELNKKIKNIITLSVIEETQQYINQNFSASITIDIDYGISSFSEHQIQQVLTVSYDNTEGAKYNAKKYIHFDSAQYVRVTISAFTASGLDTTNLKNLLLLQNEMQVARQYELANNITPSFIATSPTADALSVFWEYPANAGNNLGQLEWTWVETETESLYYNSSNVLDYNLLFKNNASRVDLSLAQTNYQIPLFYDGSGKLYYRVRAVNLKAKVSRADGKWSTVQVYNFNGHNDNLNWQVTTSYAEEGKRKTVIQYYDGSLRPRQTVTKDNVTNTTTSAETFYDAQGRPAVQILPVPSINNIVGYTKNLNLFNGQSVNEDPAKHFDLVSLNNINSFTPPLSNTTSAAAKYYSNENSELNVGANKNIPDAEGFPYTVTRYTPDASGRIMAQSGVGAAMKMGSGHETKYYYGTASQEELNALFGTEVGEFSHYFKNMVKDANGQMSVSYVDMNGRTIATALAGDAPAPVTALNLSPTHYPNQAGTSITRNLLNRYTNIIKENSIESINTILVPATGNYNFRYELNPQALEMARCSSAVPLCYDCMYNLEFSITDESGDAQPIVRKFNNISLNADDTCSTAVTNFKNDTTNAVSNIIQFTQQLAPGSYTVRKTLTISESSLQRYMDMYLAKANCKTEQQLIDSVYAVMQTVTGCNTPDSIPLTCQSCKDSLGTYTSFRTKYLVSIGMDSATIPTALETLIYQTYQSDSLSCDRLCVSVSHKLETIRQLMLADMMPYTGQYAKDSALNTPMYNKYDIFSTVNTYARPHPLYKQPWNNSTNTRGYYYNILQQMDESIHPPGAQPYALLNNLSKPAFASQFTASWANALLPHHPEYNKLLFAENNLQASYNWIEDFRLTETYATATTKGYILNAASFGTNPSDPFFALNTSAKSAMQKITTDSGYYHGLTLWQMAYGDVKCKNILNETNRNACYVTAPKEPPYSNIIATAEKDQLWNVFKGLYAAVRDSMVNKFIAANVPMSDADSLIAEQYTLHFTSSANQLASQYAWSWVPTTPGTAPAVNIADSIAAYNNTACSSQIDAWRNALLNCPQLANHNNRDTIVAAITAGMLEVCQKGTDASNPLGASTVAPSTPFNGAPRSFEAVIMAVFAQYNIDTTQFCNPFVIDFPKPYGTGPAITQNYISVIDTCNCKQFDSIKAEAIANNYQPNIYSSLNAYLRAAYKDTLTPALFLAMQQCDSLGMIICNTCEICKEDSKEESPIISTAAVEPMNQQHPGNWDAENSHTPVISFSINQTNYVDSLVCDTLPYYYQLLQPQPLPAFLQCGYVRRDTCITCDKLVVLTQQFKQYFNGLPCAVAPVFTGTDLDSATLGYNKLYAQFLNYRTGLQLGWMDYAKAIQESNCNLLADTALINQAQSVVCYDTKTLTDTVGLFVQALPCQNAYNMAVALATQIHTIRTQQLMAQFEAAYKQKCLAAAQIEQFTVNYTVKEYHYTLYYYDRAGNLVKTIPPKGVYPIFGNAYSDSINTARTNGTYKTPPHSFATNYRYNSLNQVVAQHTPDGGLSKFWYDRLGRLAVSQNAKQAQGNDYSYTLYDNFGRITEVGQKVQTTVMNQSIAQDTTALKNWIHQTGGTKSQITYTVYDKPYTPVDTTLLVQRHLRNRVSYTATKQWSTDTIHYTATFYTYDIHGNVDTLLQDYKGINAMSSGSQRFKRISYAYDLISGKVNQVAYQPNQLDAYYHKYTYDAENKLMVVSV
jgi:YD repeat-containing protein